MAYPHIDDMDDTDDTERMRLVARRYQALADPTRIRIVEFLVHGERCVCDLAEVLGAAQSRLSFHLKILREAGLLRARKAGRWMYYSVDPEGIERLSSHLGRLEATLLL